MKEAMRDEDAIFGAEPSGHYYFKSYWYADSGILASLKFYEIVSRAKAPASLLRRTFQKYINLGESNYRVSDRNASFNSLKSFIKSCKPDWESNIDGYAALKRNADGHVTYATVRKSNTEPVIRLTVESDSEKCAKQFKREAEAILKNGK
jgi:phosphomannomutase